jgi:hypothetical protein
MITITGSLCQVFAPLNNRTSNSVYFSGTAPEVLVNSKVDLPHITIQMAVYKEGLNMSVSFGSLAYR